MMRLIRINPLNLTRQRKSYSNKFFKITNDKENHFGFQYRDGLNVLTEEFNNDTKQSCCRGGFYFTDSENIFRFLWKGYYLRKVELPMGDPEFKIVYDISGDKCRANKIILGERFLLSEKKTFEYLFKEQKGNVEYALCWSLLNNNTEIAKFLINNGGNVYYSFGLPLRIIAEKGNVEILFFLREKNINIDTYGDVMQKIGSEYRHSEFVECLKK